MGGDQVGLDAESQDPQTVVEVMVPDRGVPVCRSTLEHFCAPDVVDEHVDVPVVIADPSGESRNLFGVEVVGLESDPPATELGHEIGRLLDRLRAVIVRPRRTQ